LNILFQGYVLNAWKRSAFLNNLAVNASLNSTTTKQHKSKWQSKKAQTATSLKHGISGGSRESFAKPAWLVERTGFETSRSVECAVADVLNLAR
jgi:hypothetical protein